MSEHEPMSAPLVVTVALLTLLAVGGGCFLWGCTVGVDHGPVIENPVATTLPDLPRVTP